MNREELMIVYNAETALEFIECGNCGMEIDVERYGYPAVQVNLETGVIRCPNCGQWLHPVRAEDVK